MRRKVKMKINKNNGTLIITANIKKWGNSTGVLLPKVLLDLLSIKTNDPVEISIDKKNIIISPIKKKHLSLAERFADYEGETSQTEYWNDDPIGKEIF